MDGFSLVYLCLLPYFLCVSREMLACSLLCADKFENYAIVHHLIRNLEGTAC